MKSSYASATALAALLATSATAAAPDPAAPDPAAPAAAEPAAPDPAGYSGEIVVSANRQRGAQLKAAIRDIPGAGTIIDSRDVQRGRVNGLEDLLAFQPGVFAQAGDGTGAVKISIRGSGVQTSPGYFREGIKFLYDGLPLTGPGGTPDELLDGAAVNFTEVLYGANAFKYGAAALGGAINYTTQTGATAPGAEISLSAGSFGNRKGSISFGNASDRGDYYVAIQRDLRDGFRVGTYNGGRITNFGRGVTAVGNFGYHLTDRLDVRLTARFRNEEYVNGSVMTLAQLRNDPATLPVVAGRRKHGSYLVGLTTGYDFDDGSRLEVGLGYSHFPHINAWRYSALPAYWTWTDLTGSLRYSRTGDTIFGLRSNSFFTANTTYNVRGQTRTYAVATGALYNFVRYSGSRDTVVSLGNDLQLIDGAHDAWLTTGVSLIDIRRNVRVPYSSPANPNRTPFGTAVDRTDTKIAPRIGLRYQLAPALQLVGNVSRSVDPASSWGLAGSSSPYVRNLKVQTATTFEAGLRVKTGALDGSLNLYRANVRNELLTIVLAQATAATDAVIVKANASPTVHQGVEAGLTARLWRGAGGEFKLRQAYTYSDFHYRHDPTFGGNQLPGLPRHAYQAELQFDHARGFYIGVNTRVASSYFVDYGNSLKAPSYAILGVRAGYEAPNGRYKLFIDARNITNRHYVSATSPQYDLKGVDTNVFYPGETASVFGGITFRF